MSSRARKSVSSANAPTGRGAAVALKLPANHVRFLASTFEQVRDGVRDELRECPEDLKNPEHRRREEAAYGRLLTSLEELAIVPDSDVLAILADLATMIEKDNEHARVVTEHEALHGLLDHLTGGEGR